MHKMHTVHKVAYMAYTYVAQFVELYFDDHNIVMNNRPILMNTADLCPPKTFK